MARFRFRAEAALELRRRQEDLARRARAEAAAAVERAERLLQAKADALRQALEAAGDTSDPVRGEWHRNWLVRQRQEAARARARVDACRADLEAAALRANRAHRDVRALERLRDRSYAAWALAARRNEQKELDWLGSLRHARLRRPEGEPR